MSIRLYNLCAHTRTHEAWMGVRWRAHTGQQGTLHVDHHFLVHVGVADNAAKFFEAYSPVVVLVGKEDSLVDDLLELCVFQVVPDHHLQHLQKIVLFF